MKRRYFAGAIFLCTLPMLILAGCREKTSDVVTVISETDESEAAGITAPEIVSGFVDKGYDNYRMDITYDSTTEMTTDGETVSIPSNITIEHKRAGSYIYEIQTMTVEHEELEMAYSDETYMEVQDDIVLLYSSVLNQKQWYQYETEDMKEARLVSLDPMDFENAAVKVNEKEGTYEITEPLSDLSENSDFFLDFLINDSAEGNDVAQENVEDVLQDGEYYAVYTFSKEDLKLLSIDYGVIEYSAFVSSDKKETGITSRNEISIKLSEYGKIKENKVKASKKIKDKAKKWSEITE